MTDVLTAPYRREYLSEFSEWIARTVVMLCFLQARIYEANAAAVREGALDGRGRCAGGPAISFLNSPAWKGGLDHGQPCLTDSGNSSAYFNDSTAQL